MNQNEGYNEYNINNTNEQFCDPQETFREVGEPQKEIKRWRKVVGVTIIIIVGLSILGNGLNFVKRLSSPKYEAGVIKNNTYTSEFLGLRVDCPEGYEMNTEKSDIRDGAVMELKVSETGQSNNFNIYVEKGKAPSEKEWKEQISLHTFTSATSVTDMETSEDTLAGKKYKVLKIKTTTYGVEMEQRQYLREIGDYIVYITFTGNIEKLRNNISEL